MTVRILVAVALVLLSVDAQAGSPGMARAEANLNKKEAKRIANLGFSKEVLDAETKLLLEPSAIKALQKFAYMNSEYGAKNETISWRSSHQSDQPGTCSGCSVPTGHEALFAELNKDQSQAFHITSIRYDYFNGPFTQAKESSAFYSVGGTKVKDGGLSIELSSDFEPSHRVLIAYRLYFKDDGKDVRIERVRTVLPDGNARKSGGGGAGSVVTTYMLKLSN